MQTRDRLIVELVEAVLSLVAAALENLRENGTSEYAFEVKKLRAHRHKARSRVRAVLLGKRHEGDLRPEPVAAHRSCQCCATGSARRTDDGAEGGKGLEELG